MKLLFKQRFFSWLDSYDIYDEMGNTVYTVKGELSWGNYRYIMLMVYLLVQSKKKFSLFYLNLRCTLMMNILVK